MDLMAIARRGVRMAVAEHDPQALLEAAARLLEKERTSLSQVEKTMQEKMEEMSKHGELDIFNSTRYSKSVTAQLTVKADNNELKLRGVINYSEGYPISEAVDALWIQYKKHNP